MSTEQPLDPELLELTGESEDADPGLIGVDGKHKRDRDDGKGLDQTESFYYFLGTLDCLTQPQLS
ncbi:MAG: hypothetical protein C4B59_02850 [Candidatus Methanogaster sp.]|uniref:Uncharacterized protein n=1 Tax=Candidatus Methanogaster sp. TaxID=3386292 RepID=A0AC61L634_9EURY|nr:MAG: hypothetical protein C4B59_02850 [ANME-2 cluster archaeon]